jgi:MFS family permease
VTSTSRRTFSALSVRNFRLFLLGQLISMSGTWMQTVALAVLVLQLTGRGTAVGIAFSLQFLPIMLLAPMAGVVADRVNNRGALICTQVGLGSVVSTLGVLVATGAIEIWMVYVLATALGIVNAFDTTIRQRFVYELVGPEHLTNAVGINGVMVNLARVFGPALGGLLIATVGLAPCFFYNAASFAAAIVGLLLVRSAELHRAPQHSRAEGRVRDGLRYVRATPELLIPLVVLAVIGTLAWELPVSLPLMAKFTFHRGAGMLSAMMTLVSIGGIASGLYVARHPRPTARILCFAAVLLGFAMLLAAAAPSVTLELIAMVPLGAAGLATFAFGQSALQLTTSAHMRGRVMSLFIAGWVGSSAIGGPIIGWIGDHVGARYGLVAGGIGALVPALVCIAYLARQRRSDHERVPDGRPPGIDGSDAPRMAPAETGGVL